MLQASRNFVCWKCISRTQQGCGTVLNRSGRGRRLDLVLGATRYNTTSTDTLPISAPSVGPDHIPTAPSAPDVSKDKPLSVRDKLRKWSLENDSPQPELPADGFDSGANNLTRTQSSSAAELDTIRPMAGGMTELIWKSPVKEDGEVGVHASNPGDLVELRQAGSRLPVFGIYMGYFGGRHHYYASNGRWIMSLGFGSLFTVSGFATPAELAPVLADLPKCTTPEEYEVAQKADQGPLRAVAKPLLERMRKFKSDSERVYQANMDNLDRARPLLSDTGRTKYLSLFEISDLLLPQTLKDKGDLPAHALYAVHSALQRDELAFRPLSPAADCHRRDHLFEILSSKQTQIIDRVAVMVRNYTLTMGKRSVLANFQSAEETPFGKFVSDAQEMVKASRMRRAWTHHGILSPSDEITSLKKTEWSQTSQEIIAFLEWWASYDIFEANSRWSSYGATILRALNLYPDIPLDHTVAWMFLQEIGVIAPWEIPTRYRVRFPETSVVKGGGLSRNARFELKDWLREDVAADIRVTRTSPVFAIDGPEAVLIDDAISLERTEVDDEYWIHVHAADPTSGIKPNSPLSEFIESVPENVYLAGHFQAMLPSETEASQLQDDKSTFLGSQYSLKAGSPALTFSAKVNGTGDILDYKIEPSTLNEVVYLDPEDVAIMCDEPLPPPHDTQQLSVGTPPEESSPRFPGRSITATKDLSDAHKQELLELRRLAKGIKDKRLAKGAWPYFFPKASVSVRFHGVPEESASMSEDIVLPSDPYIKVSTEAKRDCSVVSNTMVLAGEVAARWCADRKIPIPYRRNTKAAKKNFEMARKYASEVIYPLIEKGIEPSFDHRAHLTALTGGIEISTTPGPYFMMGLDAYTKATSPLRRFGDLLTHWQIHVALVEEHKVGRRLDPVLDPNVYENKLPFNEAQMANTIALLHLRERMIKVVASGTHDWILIALIRAWKFEKTAPAKFRFSVSSRQGPGLLGNIDLFGLGASMDVDGLDGKALLQDIRAGDEFDVELSNVNVHSREISVKALDFFPAEPERKRSRSPVTLTV